MPIPSYQNAFTVAAWPWRHVVTRNRLRGMARTYLVLGDIEGKLDVLRVECTRCDRKGRYSVAKLIEKHGRKGNLMVWREMLNADCPR